ncbi:MAG: serine protease [Bacteroidetes bacterium]|nr:serine protease [Bacteroidota bacterium]MBU1114140.1 serine protease [Bacteroidota bacterium]MBU1796806.1 serine protease [Bacteroidota bacterium]
MPKNIINDPAGAILEYLYLTQSKNDNKYLEREEWRKLNAPKFAQLVWNGSLEPHVLIYNIQGNQRNAAQKAQINRTLKKLEQYDLIESYTLDDSIDTKKKVITLVGEDLFLRNRYLEYIHGGQYIIDKWKKSVAKFFIPNEKGIGTGFLISPNRVATAKHVVDDLKDFKIQFENDPNVYEVSNIIRPTLINDLDLAIIELPENVKGIEPFTTEIDRNILEEIVVLGYPPIPMSDDAYLIASKGEVSAIISKYTNDIQHLIISTFVRGGNSGGPIINRRGDVIGIVTENLYNKINHEEDGLNEGLGFSAGIVSEWLDDLNNGKI